MSDADFILNILLPVLLAGMAIGIAGTVLVLHRPTDATYWRRAYEALVKQTGQDLQGPPA